MIYIIKRLLKRSLNRFGFDIVRSSKSPQYSLLGLRELPIRTVIDVGANKGQFARTIRNIFPQAHIHCFEPLPEAFSRLKEWAEKRENVTVHNIALGETIGEIRMLRHINHSPSSSILRTTETCEKLYPFVKTQETVNVKMMTLDSWFDSRNDLLRDVLVKIDVQGYENRVIVGGTRMLKISKACITEINLDRLYEDQSDFKDILLYLYSLGYYYAGNVNQSYGNDGHVIFIDALFIKH